MALTLDPVTVNTELAEKFLKNYSNFDDWPAPGKFWFFNKYPHDIIEYPDDMNEKPIKEYDPKSTSTIGMYTATRLVNKIKEHESTFYQLEYLIRKTDEPDFQSYFLLMCQHLQCDDRFWCLDSVRTVNIIMNEKTPLYALGCAAAAKSKGLPVIIVTTKKMAPICLLFTNLCEKVGWLIYLIFVNDVKKLEYINWDAAINVFEENEIRFGCTGVVTESADIDSALDSFINSSITTPWKLQRIYVQESVYDEMKEALAARCKRDAVQSCAEAFVAKGKWFVCDTMGDGNGDHVPVEAYRTSKELCTLLRQQAAPALSLWAADSQLAHEVALAAPAQLVWINEYAYFHGPPASSLPVYELLYADRVMRIKEDTLPDLQKCWIDWKELTRNERIDLIMNTLQGLSYALNSWGWSLTDFQDDILNVRDESFVSVDDGKMCVGVNPVYEGLFYVNVKELSAKLAVKYIRAVLNGTGIVYTSICPVTIKLFESLGKAGVPVIEEKQSDNKTVYRNPLLPEKVKIIRSNFGTIFAN